MRKVFLIIFLYSLTCFAAERVLIRGNAYLKVPVVGYEPVYEEISSESCKRVKTHERGVENLKKTSGTEIAGGLLGGLIAKVLTKDKHEDTQNAAIAIATYTGAEFGDEDSDLSLRGALGAGAGGLAGSKIGVGTGKNISTAVGTLVGKKTFEDGEEIITKECTSESELKKTGYSVSYRLNGKVKTKIVKRTPADFLYLPIKQ